MSQSFKHIIENKSAEVARLELLVTQYQREILKVQCEINDIEELIAQGYENNEQFEAEKVLLEQQLELQKQIDALKAKSRSNKRTAEVKSSIKHDHCVLDVYRLLKSIDKLNRAPMLNAQKLIESTNSKKMVKGYIAQCEIYLDKTSKSFESKLLCIIINSETDFEQVAAKILTCPDMNELHRLLSDFYIYAQDIINQKHAKVNEILKYQRSPNMIRC